MEFSGVFWKLYAAAARRPRVISQRGGTRSGKTFSTLQFLHLVIPEADGPGDVTSVVSETLPHLKRGAVRDFERIVGRPLSACGEWNASTLTWTYANGARLEFFSADSPDKVMGPARKRLFVNECNHIRYETYRQLAVRTTGLILLDYNPAAMFWAIEKVEPRADCVCIRTTYEDNRDFLSADQVAEIESNRGDEKWWKVYGLGEIGTLEGAVYDFDTIDALPEERSSLVEVQGLDFGFTNSLTARVQVLADTRRKVLYCRQRCYRTRMLNSDIVADLKADGVPPNVEVFADCAEPKSIEEIRRAGFRIMECDKNAPVKSDKLAFQLQWMRGWRLLVTKDSLDLIEELRNYTWAQDRDGNPLNWPVGRFDHLLDALRYAVWTKFGRDAGRGQYRITIRKNIYGHD